MPGPSSDRAASRSGTSSKSRARPLQHLAESAELHRQGEPRGPAGTGRAAAGSPSSGPRRSTAWSSSERNGSLRSRAYAAAHERPRREHHEGADERDPSLPASPTSAARAGAPSPAARAARGPAGTAAAARAGRGGCRGWPPSAGHGAGASPGSAPWPPSTARRGRCSRRRRGRGRRRRGAGPARACTRARGTRAARARRSREEHPLGPGEVPVDVLRRGAGQRVVVPRGCGSRSSCPRRSAWPSGPRAASSTSPPMTNSVPRAAHALEEPGEARHRDLVHQRAGLGGHLPRVEAVDGRVVPEPVQVHGDGGQPGHPPLSRLAPG